jgi:hypothetical protein
MVGILVDGGTFLTMDGKRGIIAGIALRLRRQTKLFKRKVMETMKKDADSSGCPI